MLGEDTSTCYDGMKGQVRQDTMLNLRMSLLYNTIEGLIPLICGSYGRWDPQVNGTSPSEYYRETISKFDVAHLIEQQRIYWKQRGTIKWVQFRDEGTKFFHANAKIKHNRNLITSLRNEDGISVTNHEAKASILQNSFKDRLGRQEFQQLIFDLEAFITPLDTLAELHVLFTEQEIVDVVKHMPSDKSPRPDGFNTGFIKTCCPIN